MIDLATLRSLRSVATTGSVSAANQDAFVCKLAP